MSNGKLFFVKNDVFVTFCLQIHLQEGLDLEVHDTCGSSSDPYIKCQFGGKTIYKNPTETITFKVFDFDRFMRDDFMGTANVSLNTLKLSEKTQFKLKLENPKMQEINIRPLGYLIVSMTLTPINEEQRELFNERSIRGIVSERKGKQEIQKDEEQTTSENENIIKNNNCYSFIEEFNGNIESQLYKKYVYVHQIIELTVYDEDPNKRVEFLGKIAIPLLNVWKV
uniref:C2 domain-containing protein n=1 Tax=Meloidogyne floridensis TaxID=298350 RepID=A0A915NJP1_9BILA